MNVNLPFLIDKNIKNQIISFALKDGIPHFIKNAAGDNRRYCDLNKTNVVLKDILTVYSDKIFNELGLTDTKKELDYGNFIGVNSENGYVHEHKDKRCTSGFYHVRVNFLVQKPISGGMPIIDNVEYDIKEEHSWINLASEWKHFSTPVIGNKERIVLSLGKFVNPSQINQLMSRKN
jgi:hypothetical protein